MVEKLLPGPTSSVFFGHPSRGFWVGYWHAFRLTAGIAAHTWRMPAKIIANLILGVLKYKIRSAMAYFEAWLAFLIKFFGLVYLRLSWFTMFRLIIIVPVIWSDSNCK